MLWAVKRSWKKILLHIHHWKTPWARISGSCVAELVWDSQHLFPWLSQPGYFSDFFRMMGNVNSFDHFLLWMVNEVVLVLVDWNHSFTWCNDVGYLWREVFWGCLLLFEWLEERLMRDLFLELQGRDVVVHDCSLKSAEIEVFSRAGKWSEFNFRSFDSWNVGPVWI